MKTLQILRNASIATLTLAAVSLPTLAQASDYNRGYDQSRACKSKENDAQLAGGLIGAAIGGIVGSEIAGRGDRNEGAVIGAVIGGLAGVGIGDESVNCDKRRRRTAYNGSNSGYSNVVYNGSGYRNNNRNYGYRNTGYSSNRRYNNGRRYNNAYERHDHDDRIYRYNATYAELTDVQYRLQTERRKVRRLQRKIQYAETPYHSHDLQERLDKVRYEVNRLQKKQYRLQARLRKLKRHNYSY